MRGDILGPLLRMAACGVLFDALVPLAPFLATQTGRTDAAVQAAIAMVITGFAVAQLGAAPWLRRIGLRAGMIISSACLVSLGLIVACLPRSGGALPLLVAMFLVNAPGSVAARAMLRNVLDHAGYQRVIGRLYAALEGFEIILPFVIIPAARAFDWRMPFLGICLAVLASIAPACLRRHPVESRPRSSGQRARSIARERDFLVPALLLMLMQGSFTAVALAKPAILLGPLRMTPPQLEETLSGLALLTFAGFQAGSALTHAMSDQARIRLGLLLQCGAAVALMLSAMAPDPLMFVGGCALAALACCTLLPVLHALAIDMPGPERVDASAWLGFLQGAGSGVIVLLGSVLALPPLTRLASTVTVCTVFALLIASAGLRNTGERQSTQARQGHRP